MLPAIFGSSVAQLNLLLNTIIASYLVVGSVSWLYFSDRFVELPLAIVGVAIGTVILPRLSSNHATKDETEFRQTLDWALRLGLIIALPATLGLILLAKPILATVMMYGAYTWRDVEMSGLSLMTYSIGLPAFILVKLLAPGFYSRQDTKTPVRIGVIAVVSNMIFNVLIVLPWYWFELPGAHAGLALATALAGFVNAGLLFVALRREQVLSTQQGWGKYVMQLVLACLVSGLIVWLLTPADSWWQTASALYRIGALLGLLIVSVVSYLVTLQLTGMKLRQMLYR
jgi:putative peptidoglycan lipid II flippase